MVEGSVCVIVIVVLHRQYGVLPEREIEPQGLEVLSSVGSTCFNEKTEDKELFLKVWN